VAVDDEHLRLLQGLGITSALVVPLRGRGGVLGAISLIRDGAEPFRDEDVPLAEDLAHRAALALESARPRPPSAPAEQVPTSRTADQEDAAST
jgi:GAF domain-containing protein